MVEATQTAAAGAAVRPAPPLLLHELHGTLLRHSRLTAAQQLALQLVALRQQPDAAALTVLAGAGSCCAAGAAADAALAALMARADAPALLLQLACLDVEQAGPATAALLEAAVAALARRASRDCLAALLGCREHQHALSGACGRSATSAGVVGRLLAYAAGERGLDSAGVLLSSRRGERPSWAHMCRLPPLLARLQQCLEQQAWQAARAPPPATSAGSNQLQQQERLWALTCAAVRGAACAAPLAPLPPLEALAASGSFQAALAAMLQPQRGMLHAALPLLCDLGSLSTQLAAAALSALARHMPALQQDAAAHDALSTWEQLLRRVSGSHACTVQRLVAAALPALAAALAGEGLLGTHAVRLTAAFWPAATGVGCHTRPLLPGAPDELVAAVAPHAPRLAVLLSDACWEAARQGQPDERARTAALVPWLLHSLVHAQQQQQQQQQCASSLCCWGCVVLAAASVLRRPGHKPALTQLQAAVAALAAALLRQPALAAARSGGAGGSCSSCQAAAATAGMYAATAEAAHSSDVAASVPACCWQQLLHALAAQLASHQGAPGDVARRQLLSICCRLLAVLMARRLQLLPPPAANSSGSACEAAVADTGACAQAAAALARLHRDLAARKLVRSSSGEELAAEVEAALGALALGDAASVMV